MSAFVVDMTASAAANRTKKGSDAEAPDVVREEECGILIVLSDDTITVIADGVAGAGLRTYSAKSFI